MTGDQRAMVGGSATLKTPVKVVTCSTLLDVFNHFWQLPFKACDSSDNTSSLLVYNPSGGDVVLLHLDLRGSFLHADR